MAVYGFPESMIGSGPGKVSKHLIAYITTTTPSTNVGTTEEDVCIMGLIGQGTSRELTANWEQPFNSDTIMSFLKANGGKLADVLEGTMQASGMTTVMTYNSRQVWSSGNHSLNLVLKFMAFSDPVKQVMMPIAMLEKIASVDPLTTAATDNSTSAGRQPSKVSVNMGRVALFPTMVIKSVSTPLDKEKDKNGNLIRAEVSIALEPYEMINRGSIMGTFGLS